MKNVIYYIFVLIVLFLVLLYYKGFASDVSTTGSAVNSLVGFLQGRNSKTGGVVSYPTN